MPEELEFLSLKNLSFKVSVWGVDKVVQSLQYGECVPLRLHDINGIDRYLKGTVIQQIGDFVQFSTSSLSANFKDVELCENSDTVPLRRWFFTLNI